MLCRALFVQERNFHEDRAAALGQYVDPAHPLAWGAPPELVQLRRTKGIYHPPQTRRHDAAGAHDAGPEVLACRDSSIALRRCRSSLASN